MKMFRQLRRELLSYPHPDHYSAVATPEWKKTSVAVPFVGLPMQVAGRNLVKMRMFLI